MIEIEFRIYRTTFQANIQFYDVCGRTLISKKGERERGGGKAYTIDDGCKTMKRNSFNSHKRENRWKAKQERKSAHQLNGSRSSRLR